MVVLTVPNSLKDINLLQLEAYSKLFTELAKEDKSIAFVLSDNETYEAVEKSNRVAGYLSDLLGYSKEMILEFSIETMGKIDNCLEDLGASLIKELQSKRQCNVFKIKKDFNSFPRFGRCSLDFIISKNIANDYPSFAFTKVAEILTKVKTTPISNIAEIRNLTAYLMILNPKDHAFNTQLTKDIHNNMIYSTENFNKRKDLLDRLNAVTAIQLLNFFLQL